VASEKPGGSGAWRGSPLRRPARNRGFGCPKLEAFVKESGDALLRTATLLTSDRRAAEDVY
jgi:hypothetical protein